MTRTSNLFVDFFALLGVIFLPIYLWGSGGMQISHGLLAVSFIILVVSSGFRLNDIDYILIALIVFVALRVTYEFLNAGGENIQRFLPALYLLFNLSIFYLFREWMRIPSNRHKFFFGYAIAVHVALVGVLLLGFKININQEGGRAVGTFNNPNQLGYFSVCSFSILVLLYKIKTVKLNYVYIIMPTIIFLALASLSKAAMISVLGCFLIFLLSFKKKYFSYGALAGVGLIAYFYNSYLRGDLTAFAFYHRLMSIGVDNDDSLAGRGYSAVSEMGGLEILLGIGPFKTLEIVGHEVHSTFFSFFVNYGFVGFAIFMFFIILWFRALLRRFDLMTAIVIAAPPVLYGITHNGSRFTIFWILLGVTFSTLYDSLIVVDNKVNQKRFKSTTALSDY